MRPDNSEQPMLRSQLPWVEFIPIMASLEQINTVLAVTYP